MSSISSSADSTTTTSLLGDDKNRIVYWQDDALLIRRFEPDDTRAVQDLFCVANRTSMFPQALWQFGMSPMFLGGTALAVAVVHSTVRLACQRLVPLITAQRNGTPRSNGGNDDSPLSGVLTSLTTHANWWTWSASMATLLLSYWSLHRSTVQAVDKFMHRNLSDDMWQIGTVYLGHPPAATHDSSVNGQDDDDTNKVVVDHGNYGNFIVAIDKASGALIGCVGGHDRTNEQHKDDDDKTKPYLGIFELRRMAVHPDHRRRSLARHLMRVLEESLLNQQHEQQQQTKSLQRQGTSIYLTCSTIQRAASFLYHKCGYTIVDSYRPTKAPLWIRYSGLTVFRFEKQTLYPNHKGESKPTTPTTPTTTC